jgi:hypothetical protein
MGGEEERGGWEGEREEPTIYYLLNEKSKTNKSAKHSRALSFIFSFFLSFLLLCLPSYFTLCE